MTDVEPATMDDVDRLVDLWAALADGQRDHGSRVDPADNRETMRQSLARHVFSGGVLVARTDDDVVGFAMFGPDESGLERDVDRGVVRNLYVVPDARDRGVGGRLLSAAESHLADAGADEVVLEVLADNEAARRFYEGAGYLPHRLRLAKPLESDTHTR